MEEFIATVKCERNRWPESVILGVVTPDNRNATVKLACDESVEFRAGETLKFFGRWVEHYKYGPQFAATTCAATAPHDQRGVVAYLSRVPGVTPTAASALWDAYKADAVRALRESPDAVAAEIVRRRPRLSFTVEIARRAARHLEGKHADESATIDLLAIIAGSGIPHATIPSIIRRFGARAVEIVRRDPLKLMQFQGVGFARADRIYLDCGKNPARLKRQALCAWNAIARDADGHTWFTAASIADYLRREIASAGVQPVRAIKLGLRARLLAFERSDDVLYITERGRADAESTVAERLVDLLAQPAEWPDAYSIPRLSEHQRDELARALSATVCALVGSPGTGKTFTAAQLIGAIVELYGLASVAVVAPTGKAAVRVTEILRQHGIEVGARTIHSFLGVERASESMRKERTIAQSERGWTFKRNRSNPLCEKFLIVDESSMLDVELTASLLAAVPRGGHVLLVGDTNQLPPVGHGAPLRDMLQSRIVPAGDLREIRRNSGAIVETCAKIRDGSAWTVAAADSGSGANLVIVPADSSESIAAEIVRLVTRFRNSGEVDPLWDLQVLVPLNDRTECSRAQLNLKLQGILNSRAGSGKYRIGDKVICGKNGFYGSAGSSKEKVYVCNGDQGRIVAETPTLMTIELRAPCRRIAVPKIGEDGSRCAEPVGWDLAYAITVHKSQGSEWPHTIVALDPTPAARMVGDRSWFYTAISRAQKSCTLVGEERTAQQMVRCKRIKHRKTLLTERLTHATVEV